MLVVFILTIFFILFHIFFSLENYYKKSKSNNGNPRDIKNHKEFAILVPCYNEEVVINASIKSFSKMDYPNCDVIFINDGSSDETFNILMNELNLERVESIEGKLECKGIKSTYVSKKYNNVFVIDKYNGGKADSLNAGINFTEKKYVVTLDADSILNEDALYHINTSLQDEDIIAVGGNVVVSQGIENYSGKVLKSSTKKSLLESAQFIEYLRGFFILKNSYAKLNSLFVISGAFGIFDRNVMVELGGFNNTVGEDIDITIRFNKYALEHKKKITYNDEAMCFTEVPNSWRDVANQRIRWQKAFLDAFKNNFGFLFKNFFKVRLAFFMLCEAFLLMYVSTLITILGIFIVIEDELTHKPINFMIVILFCIGIVAFIIYNIATFFLTSKSKITLKTINCPKLILVLIYEFVFYRPLMISIILYGSVEYIFKPGGWNRVKRIGTSNSIV